MQVTIKNGQWLGDVALREAGSIDALVSLAVINNVSVTQLLVAGDKLQAPAIVNRRVVNHYQINDIHPATAVATTGTVAVGIDEMAVEINFAII